ncbi:MAG: hypothetical protein QG673_1000 [Pseudomonadota bacterium]|nr:hypothetical protein [Pseudomonadota bacterium]
MKILRLFISNDLENPVNWVKIDDGGDVETGSSNFTDLALFDEIPLEIYLSTSCCSIFKADVTGISAKRMTEELVLGLIEDSLVDEIDDVSAITLLVEDNVAYVAVFNRVFYEALMHQIHDLNKPIRFIQSFAFTTLYEDGAWTVFLSEGQRFVRISKYEYYSLDDNKPLPDLLEEMLQSEQPQSLLLYADKEYEPGIARINKRFGIECANVSGQYVYGVPVWNFHIQKSTSFNIKLDNVSKRSISRLLKKLKYLTIFLISFWVLDILMLTIDGYRLKGQIKDNLKGVVEVSEINHTLIQTASDKIKTLRHQRGIYDDKDAVVLFTKFLQIVSSISPNEIKQIEYNGGYMEIILGSNFDTSQFVGYKDILETRQVIAEIEDYKAYSKKKKKNLDRANNALIDDAGASSDSSNMLDDAAWVITLKPALWHEAVSTQKD